MISMIRVDERLIHGQVALIWTKHLGVNRIIVVNDKAASDVILSSTLKMAAPDTVKVIVLAKKDVIKLLSDARIQQLNILIVVDSPADARFVVDHVEGVKKVNIGNFGRVLTSKEPRMKLNDNVYLSNQDKEDLKSIIDRGIQTEYQLVPDQSVLDLKKYFNKGE
ncbi:PTS sugar transporter subunit IIB [Enterococcus camelliae]|uniref:PTS sugar transporter subunit IIB n=1 Tax=Enterococcus camelliae TaxID=453959 RepID=A0ABW5TGL8_9ENTE